MAAVGGFAGPLLLDDLFGPAVGCVRTTIAAGTAGVTTINTGSCATGGASGNMDATPANNSLVIIATPGSGATQNQLSVIHAFVVTSAIATALTIPSQTIGPAITAGDFIFYLGLTTQTGPILLNTLYLCLSTQVWSASVTDANLKSGEPTSAGLYARIPILNTPTNWPLATGPVSGVSTAKLATAQSYTQSNGAWSSGSTPLASMFLSDSSTLAGGNVIWSGPLSPATDIVNGTGVTMQFGANAITATIT